MQVPLGDTYEFLFTTRNFSTGAPYTLAGTPVLSVYEESNLTQITSGVTVSADYDSVTGLNQAAVVATSGNGYEVGKYYSVVITTGTVNSVSVVGEVIGHFRIMAAEGVAGVPDANVTNWLDTAVTLSSTSSKPEVDAYSISDDATSANNLELQYDGTGLTGDTYPASQSQLGNITNTGAAVNAVAESYVLTTGTQSANTYTATAPLDGVRHEHTDTTGAMELYYQFDVGTEGVPTSVTMTGYLTGGNDALGVYAYNWAGTSWDQIGTLTGGAATNKVETYALYITQVGTGANIGKVRIRFYEPTTLTTATLAIDQIYTSYAVVPVSLQTKGSVSDVSPAAGGFNTDLTDATNKWNDCLLIFTSGTLADESKPITSYVVTNGAVTFDEAFTGAPANGDTFIVSHTHIHPVTQISTQVMTDLDANGSTVIDELTTQGDTNEAKIDTLTTNVGAVKTKTDSLTFTTAGEVDANVQSVNDVAITGDGSATPFNV